MDRFRVVLMLRGFKLHLLLLHKLIELVAHTHIVLKVPLGFRLALLEPHQHEILVRLGLT